MHKYVEKELESMLKSLGICDPEFNPPFDENMKAICSKPSTLIQNGNLFP